MSRGLQLCWSRWPILFLIPLFLGALAACGGAPKPVYFPGYPVGFVERGVASWYGPGFHGNKTANGERYDMHQLTAAHRTLPLGSVAVVRSRSTGRQVTVRINDRLDLQPSHQERFRLRVAEDDPPADLPDRGPQRVA